jgi:transcriptional regulator with XRE-family HTH domain
MSPKRGKKPLAASDEAQEALAGDLKKLEMAASAHAHAGITRSWPEHYRDGRVRPKNDFSRPNYTHIAKYCDVSIMHISRIFRGLANPSVPLLDKMTGYFGLPMSELWDLLKQKKPRKQAVRSEPAAQARVAHD